MDYEIGGMCMKTGLDKLPLEIPAVVLRVSCSKEFQYRLRDFGLVPGTKVIVRYRSPCGGVVALELRGTVIALRTRDVRGVKVQWQ